MFVLLLFYAKIHFRMSTYTLRTIQKEVNTDCVNLLCWKVLGLRLLLALNTVNADRFDCVSFHSKSPYFSQFD